MLGSCAYCGLSPSPDHLAAMETLGISREDYDAARAPVTPDWALELHIEQGGVLEHRQKEIGIVTSIVAIRRYLVVFSGTANHAGTTPMELRDDALIKAARFVQRVREVAMATHPEMVGTVGRLEVSPGSENTIPGRVQLTLELRSQQEEHVETAYRTLMEEFREEISDCRLTQYQRSFPMDRTIRATIAAVCEENGFSAMEMGSGAGHDSMTVAQVARTGMIFVPSVDGISHSPAERTHWKDVRQGAQVLLQTILSLDSITE
jgi:N-carbamoyl-L-amino-acid hydrolase